jgi:succinoglycan biosynthesis transport protein ExoP
MTERPVVKQDLAYLNLPGRPEDGRAEGRGTALVLANEGVGRNGMRQPRFAITVGKMREALLHRWKLALLVGLIFTGVGAGLAWLTYQPKYTATAYIEMSSNEPHLLAFGPAGDVRNTREEEFRKNQVFKIKSHAVLKEVLKMDEIRGLNTIHAQEHPDIWLEKELQAGFLPVSDWCKISLSGEDPEELARIVNAVKKVYTDQAHETFVKNRDNHLDNINKVLEKQEKENREQKDILKKLAETLNTGDTQTANMKQQTWYTQYSNMVREEEGLKSKIREVEALLVVMRADKVKAAPESQAVQALLFAMFGMMGGEQDEATTLIEEYLDRHPQVQKVKGEIAQLEAKIKECKKTVVGGNATLTKLEDELSVAHAQLTTLTLDLQPEATKKIQGHFRRQRISALAKNEEHLKVLKEQLEVVAKQATELLGQANLIGKGSFELENRKGTIAEADDILKLLRKTKAHLEIERLNNKENITGDLPAEVPTVNQASLLKTGSLYSLAGLFLGLFGVSYLEARVRRVHKSTEIHQELGIETLGVLPILAQKDGRAYGRAQTANDLPTGIMFTEAVNGLCATLLCDDRLCRGSVIMVTSASENEGKTLLATQLAAGLARTGRRTLLIDCDLRNPRCHVQFGLPVGPGLSEVLRGEVELASAFQTLPESEARILTAGQCNAEVTKALSNGNLAALLARFRQEFDCIIIDSAPTLVVSDGLLIGKLADGVILVVRPKVSKAPAVFSAYEQLTGLKIRTLGVVVNANPAKASSSYYARY